MALDLAYDESGSGDILLVSVQIAPTEQAKKLKRKWTQKLEVAGVEYFHSKEFDNFSSGVFFGLDRSQRINLLKGLAGLVQRHISVGITGKVTKSIYEQKTTNLFRSKWGTAYTFAIQMLVVCAYIFAERFNFRPEFNILVEDGHRHAAQAIQSLHVTKKAGMALSIPSRLLNIGRGAKRDHPILQSADMLAYSEWQKSNNGDLTIYKAMHPATSGLRPEFVDFDAELVDIVTNSAEKWMAHRKAFGQNRAREIAQRKGSK